MAQKKQYTWTEQSQCFSTVEERGESPLKIETEIHINDLSDEALQELQGSFYIALDFETGCISVPHKENPDGHCKEGCALVPKKGMLQQVQLCGPGRKVHIIRLLSYKTGRRVAPLNLMRLLEKIPIKLVHYTHFEMSWAAYHLQIPISGLWLCTKIANQILFPAEKQSLQNLVQQHLGIEILKDDELWKWGWDQEELSPRQIEYSAHDVIYLPDLYHALMSKMDGTDAHNWYEFCLTQQDLVNLETMSGKDRKVLGRM